MLLHGLLNAPDAPVAHLMECKTSADDTDASVAMLRETVDHLCRRGGIVRRKA